MKKLATRSFAPFRLGLLRGGLAVAVCSAGVAFVAPHSARAATTKKKPRTTKASVKTTKTTKAKTASAVAKGVTQVKIDSDTNHYYVLYAKPVAGQEWELPVSITMGQSGSTTLTDGRRQLDANRYRVETVPIASPGDIDGDGVDDLMEQKGAPALNPLSAVMKLEFKDGVAVVPDRATYEKISYQGEEVFRDSYLAGLEFVKFYISKSDTPRPLVYVMNTENWRAHPMFAQATGIGTGRGRGVVGEMRGDVTYYPKAMGPDGTRGLYRFAFQPNDSYSFAEISVVYEALANQFPFLVSKLAYFPMQAALPVYEEEKQLYAASRVPVVLEAELIN
jgi:hypothetical protein